MKKRVYDIYIYILKNSESQIFPSFPVLEALDEMQIGIPRENVSVERVCVCVLCVIMTNVHQLPANY